MKRILITCVCLVVVSAFSDTKKVILQTLTCQNNVIVDMALRRVGHYYSLENTASGSDVVAIHKNEAKIWKSFEQRYSNLEIDPRRGLVFLIKESGEVSISRFAKTKAAEKLAKIDHQGPFLDTFFSLMNRNLYLLSSDGLALWSLDPVSLRVEKIFSGLPKEAELSKLERILISSDGTSMYWLGRSSTTQKLVVGSYKFKQSKWQTISMVGEIPESIGFEIHKNNFFIAGVEPRVLNSIHMQGKATMDLEFPADWNFQSYLFLMDSINAVFVSKEDGKSCVKVFPLKTKL